LTPGPDKLSWRHIKKIAQNDVCLQNIINIADACIDLGHWPSHFKMSLSIIIPKPNKVLYDSTKTFRPIVLLNTLGKLIKKVISNRLQSILKDLIHPCQLDGLKQCSTMDMGVVLTYIICTGWVKSLLTSTLAFDIA